jgi:hypothetical protein
MLVLKPRYPSGCPGRFLQVVIAMEGERRYVIDPIIRNGTAIPSAACDRDSAKWRTPNLPAALSCSVR